jgi:hypothetical protein
MVVRAETSWIRHAVAAVLALCLIAFADTASAGRGHHWGSGHGGWHGRGHSSWGHGDWGRHSWHGRDWGRRSHFNLGIILSAPALLPPIFAPPVVVRPPPVIVAPGPIDAVPTSPTFLSRSGQYCREFQSSAVIAGRPQPVYGTACQQPDGAWRVVR